MAFTQTDKDLARTCLQDSIKALDAHPLRNTEKPNLKENFDMAILHREDLIERIDDLFDKKVMTKFEMDLMEVSIRNSIEIMTATLMELEDAASSATAREIKVRLQLISTIKTNIRYPRQ